MQNNINWKRFWSPYGDKIYLEGDGYLYNPDTDHLFKINPNVVFIDELENVNCLVLLGEPGIGKSSTLEEYYESINNQYHNFKSSCFLQ